ncbi:FxLYD domain-containing protein [[Eubacterium] cellulosolvens]
MKVLIKSKKNYQKSNGKINMLGIKLLVISSLIMLILPWHSVASAEQLIVNDNHSSYLSSTGVLHVVGEIVNDLTKTVKNVQITAKFYDSDNNTIATVSTYSMLNIILPGEKSPFEILLSDQTKVNQVSNYSLAVSDYSKPIDVLPQNLRVISHAFYISPAQYFNTHGKILNEGPSKSTYTIVTATFYGEKGEIVGASYGYSDPSTIISGKEAQFALVLRDVDQSKKVRDYKLQVQSNESTMIPEFPLVVVPLFIAMLASIMIIRRMMHMPTIINNKAIDLTSTA